MDLEKLHERGERVTVRWPGGPYDFVLEYQRAEPVSMSGWDDWFMIHGFCVEPVGVQHQTMRQFYVHPVDDGYALLPKRER